MYRREILVQPLDRTQPSLPLVKGRAATMTHNYKRHGTTTLFAALDVLTGKGIGSCLPKHRHSEFLTFLKIIDREVPAKHPRFQLHFTPTSSSGATPCGSHCKASGLASSPAWAS